jgi:hypothetical protein
MTAGLAALASALLPGKSLGANRTAASAAQTASSGAPGTPGLPAPATGAQLGLQGPSAAPTPAPAPQQSQPSPQAAPSGGGGGVVSGGS